MGGHSCTEKAGNSPTRDGELGTKECSKNDTQTEADEDEQTEEHNAQMEASDNESDAEGTTTVGDNDNVNFANGDSEQDSEDKRSKNHDLQMDYESDAEVISSAGDNHNVELFADAASEEASALEEPSVVHVQEDIAENTSGADFTGDPDPCLHRAEKHVCDVFASDRAAQDTVASAQLGPSAAASRNIFDVMTTVISRVQNPSTVIVIDDEDDDVIEVEDDVTRDSSDVTEQRTAEQKPNQLDRDSEFTCEDTTSRDNSFTNDETIQENGSHSVDLNDNKIKVTGTQEGDVSDNSDGSVIELDDSTLSQIADADPAEDVKENSDVLVISDDDEEDVTNNNKESPHFAKGSVRVDNDSQEASKNQAVFKMPQAQPTKRRHTADQLATCSENSTQSFSTGKRRKVSPRPRTYNAVKATKNTSLTCSVSCCDSNVAPLRR